MKSSQEQTSENLNKAIPGFGERLKLAFAGKNNAEIAKVLGVKPSAVSNYLTDQVPKLAVLFKIREQSRCSLEWLLTGEGPQRVSTGSGSDRVLGKQVKQQDLPELEPEARRAIEQIAASNDWSFDQAIVEIVLDWLQERNQIQATGERIMPLLEMTPDRAIDNLPADVLGQALKQLLKQAITQTHE